MNLGKHTCFLKRRRNIELHYTWNWCDFKYSCSRHFDRFRFPLWECMACRKFYIIWSHDASFIYVINPITCTETRTKQKTFLRLWIILPFISLLQVRTLPFYWLPCRVQRVGPYLASFGDLPLLERSLKPFSSKNFFLLQPFSTW